MPRALPHPARSTARPPVGPGPHRAPARARTWPRSWLGAAALGLALLTAGPAAAVEPLQRFDVVLLQPGSLIEQRVPGVDALADYIEAISAAATQAVQANPAQIPSAGFLVVAVRPGGRARVWLDFKPRLFEPTARALTEGLQAVPAVPTRQGPVVFALRVGLWGAKAPAAVAPSPDEWREAARQAGHALETDALIDALWPAEPPRP